MAAMGQFDIFQKMLLKMSDLNPGLIMKKLTVGLSEYYELVERWRKDGSLYDDSYCRVMFQIETIIHFSTVISFAPDCLSQISFNELRRCEKIVRKLMIFIISSSPEWCCQSLNITEHCLATLQKMKTLGQDVSIPLSLFRCLSIDI